MNLYIYQYVFDSMIYNQGINLIINSILLANILLPNNTIIYSYHDLLMNNGIINSYTDINGFIYYELYPIK